MVQEWDVSLTRTTKAEGGPIQVALPSVVARELRERGFTRAKVRLTDDGILVVPYVGQKTTVVLPESWGGGSGGA